MDQNYVGDDDQLAMTAMMASAASANAPHIEDLTALVDDFNGEPRYIMASQSDSDYFPNPSLGGRISDDEATPSDESGQLDKQTTITASVDGTAEVSADHGLEHGSTKSEDSGNSKQYPNPQSNNDMLANNVIPADVEEDDDSVDISLWTRQNPVIKLSQSPKNLPEEIDPLSAMMSRSTSPRLRDTASQSSEGVDEIPFAATDSIPQTSKTILSNESMETITVPKTLSGARSVNDYWPLDIEFKEGPRELELLPGHLYSQLLHFCRSYKTDWPSCVRTRWPSTISIFRTSTGNRSWFENPQTGETLLAARYIYGKKGQFVVVQQPSGSTSNFNDGKAAIVLHDPSSADQRTKDDVTMIYSNWYAWLPSGKKSLAYARRIVEHDKTKPPIPRPSKITTKAPSAGVHYKTPLYSRPAKSELEDVTTTQRHRKRPSFLTGSSEENERSPKRARMSPYYIDPSLLKADYPKTGSLGARRDPTTGEILLRRKTDGKLIMLRCTECDYNGCESQQGLLNHFRTSHDIEFAGHDDMQNAIAIEVIEPTRPQSPRSEFRRPHPTKPEFRRPQNINLPSQSPPAQLRRTSRRLATPPQSATTYDDLDADDPDEPEFEFSKGIDDPNPRIRPVRTIDSADKLFVHALAAGVAKKDTLMLTVELNNRKPVQIVRGDNEDFQMVLQMIKKSKAAKVVAVVTVEDLQI